jgi:hypothetical protein
MLLQIWLRNISISMIPMLCKILKEYAAFETEVRQQIADICAPHCSVCKRVCCRPEYCRESIDSIFLTFLSSNTMQNTAYNDRCGWLAPTGCALTAGRPPVCYQFNCQKIWDALPDDTHRYLLGVLSELVPHVGKRALGSRHLVEIMDVTALERVDIDRFRKRLTEARNALKAIQSFAVNRRLPAAALAALKKIKPMPTSPASRIRISRCTKPDSAGSRLPSY